MRSSNMQPMRIDQVRAHELADQELAQLRRPGLDLIFLDDLTEEVPEGWFFFWDDRRHAETGELQHALGGGGPIFVARAGDVVHMVWSGESWQTALHRYRETGSMSAT
jgi:hypothetical protein